MARVAVPSADLARLAVGAVAVYWLPGAQRYVDGRGEAVQQPVPVSGRAVTRLVRDGRQVARAGQRPVAGLNAGAQDLRAATQR